METTLELDPDVLQVLDSEEARLSIVSRDPGQCDFTCALSCFASCQNTCEDTRIV
ncbi:hypothetical protein AB0E85_18470 [Streptomyces sp. NPDC029044]|uniref:hypothetical protein n=1 Tax=Streptomyces sp. NPDC029044 TaxID=3157198 RepID=UPI0033E591D5